MEYMAIRMFILFEWFWVLFYEGEAPFEMHIKSKQMNRESFRSYTPLHNGFIYIHELNR